MVQISDRIITVCKAYIKGVKDAQADLRHILLEVGSLNCVLEVLELSAAAPDSHFGGRHGNSGVCRLEIFEVNLIINSRLLPPLLPSISFLE